jgi:isoleucyl-tRNA synthetase
MDSVHTSLFSPLGVSPFQKNHLETLMRQLFDLRLRVNEKIEGARRDKIIGKSLEARVNIASKELTQEQIEDDFLEELFIVSKVIITPTEGEETITVTRAEDHGMKKCIRCWKYYDHIGTHPGHPELCDRCTKVVVDLGFN